MIDTGKLEWGLRPFKAGYYLAGFGARTIWNGNKITFLPDRQQFIGNSKTCEALRNLINNKALPKLKQYITDHHWTEATTEIYTHIDRNMLRSEIIEHHPRNIKYRKEKER